MARRTSPENLRKVKRVFPRVDSSTYEKIQAIAKNRGQNLSELTRELYEELIEEQTFKLKEPAA
jgi:predicted DNA-binding protein